MYKCNVFDVVSKAIKKINSEDYDNEEERVSTLFIYFISLIYAIITLACLMIQIIKL